MVRHDRDERNSPFGAEDESNSDLSASSDEDLTAVSEGNPQKRRHSGTDSSRRSPTPSPTSEKAKPRKKRRAAATKPRAKKENTVTPWNWQRKGISSDRMGRLNFKGGSVIEDGLAIILADKSILRSGNFVYVMAEPVGEPYYVGRVMEFVPIADPSKPDSDNPNDLYQVRLNWLYRPADLHKTAKNSRELLLTMHADLCPLASLRGRCNVKHRAEIGTPAELQTYMQTPNNFWFDRLWDRYIERFFDVVPCGSLESLPLQVRETLRTRYQYVVLEPAKTKELTNGISKQCKTCSEWSTDEDSVTCARCDATYHMACLDPPLVYRPPRGFGWSCAACAQAVEDGFQDRQQVGPRQVTPPKAGQLAARPTSPGSETSQESAPIPTYLKLKNAVAEYAEKTADHVRQEYLWPFRYLGIHSNLEDAFDADDRIHPRAASRIGNKQQAVVKAWPGRPVVYYQRSVAEGRMRGRRTAKKVAKKENSPPGLDTSLPWVQEMPKGYLQRGSDATSTLMWANDVGDPKEFLSKTKVYAEKLNLHHTSPNFFDACLKAFHDSGGDEAQALRVVSTLTRKALKEPTFTDEEIERFEEGVEQFGSELHDVYKHVGTQSSADIVRFYYLWKKTPGGHQVWDNCQARISRRKASKQSTEFTASIADTADPEITFSSEKIKKLQKTVECKHCHTNSSRKWKRASGRMPTEEDDPIEALCMRCARLWYRYGVVWQHPEQVLAIYHSKGNAKDKIEPELLEDTFTIVAQREKSLEDANKAKQSTAAAAAKKEKDEFENSSESESEDDIEGADAAAHHADVKSESLTDALKSTTAITEDHAESESDEEDESEEEEDEEEVDDDEDDFDDNVDETVQNSYCAICCQRDPYMTSVQCADCSVIVHRACYSIEDDTRASSWLCDPCSNNRSPKANLTYQCSLCPCSSVSYIQWIQGNGVGNPDLLRKAEYGRWAHQRCAVWNPKVKFASVDKHQIAVGVVDALAKESPEECEICHFKIAVDNCCDICSKRVHTGCAGSQGFSMGFVINPEPAEGSPTVVFDDKSGTLDARIRCPHHDIDDLIPMSEIDEVSGQSILQLYVERYLQCEYHETPIKRASLVHSQCPPQKEKTLVMEANHDTPPLFAPILPSRYSCATCHVTSALYWYNVTTPDKPSVLKLQCPRCFTGGNPLPSHSNTPALPPVDSPLMDHVIRNIVR